MSKLMTMREAIEQFVPDGASVALGLQLEQMIPFAAGHEIMRQRKRDLTLIGPISDILFDQMIGGGCAGRVIAAWVGNVMMGSGYCFRRAVEGGELPVVNMTNLTIALALQAAATGVPFLPTRTALGSEVARENEFFAEIHDPFSASRAAEPGSASTGEGARSHARKLHAVRALAPDVAIVHVQRSDADGNAHCWGNLGVMIEAVRASRRVIVCAEEIVTPQVIRSDPNRTVVPGFLASAVVEAKMGAHPSPVQGYYDRDNAFFRQYHEQSKTRQDFERWAQRWIHGVADREQYVRQLGTCRVEELGVKRHAYAAPADFGY